MAYEICYWDEISKTQKTRDSTLQEDAQREIDIAVSVAKKVPLVITSRQAVQQLIIAGLYDNILPALNSIPDVLTRKLAIAEWEKAQEFERNRPLVQSIGGALGLTSAQLDDLFIAAAKLV